MKLKARIFCFITLVFLARSAWAVPFTFEGRSLGMGGVSVATADLATAAWANPAMLTNQRPSDDFSLLIGVGAMLRDDENLRANIQDFQDADQRRKSGDINALAEMQAIIGEIEGKVIAPEASGVVAMGMAFESFAMAVSVRGDVIGGGTVTDLSSNPNEIIDENFNILNIEGVLATEIGVSFAKDFNIYNRRVSFGIKPKVVDLQVFSHSQPILNAATGISDISKEDSQYKLGTFTTFDLGAAVELSKSWRVGLNIRNLITDDFDVNGQTLNFDTAARVGVAYHDNLFTVAVDYDLIENDPLLSNPTFKGLKTRFIAVGAEFNAFDFAQLRVGASKNLAGGISSGAKDTTITAGIGFWLGFNLDVAATFRNDSVGGFVQTGFRF